MASLSWLAMPKRQRHSLCRIRVHTPSKESDVELWSPTKWGMNPVWLCTSHLSSLSSAPSSIKWELWGYLPHRTTTRGKWDNACKFSGHCLLHGKCSVQGSIYDCANSRSPLDTGNRGAHTGGLFQLCLPLFSQVSAGAAWERSSMALTL